MGKGNTQRYYDANPAANKRRIAKQIKYNKHGSSKPGTKNINGNDISRNAVRLNRHLGTYGKNDGKDASHNMYGKGKHGTEDDSTNRAEPHYKNNRKKNNKNKRKLYIT